MLNNLRTDQSDDQSCSLGEDVGAGIGGAM